MKSYPKDHNKCVCIKQAKEPKMLHELKLCTIDIYAK